MYCMQASVAAGQRFGERPSWHSISVLQHLPQDGLQDAAVAVVLDLDRRIDAAGGQRTRLSSPSLGRHADLQLLPGLEVVADRDVERLFAGQAERCGGSARA